MCGGEGRKEGGSVWVCGGEGGEEEGSVCVRKNVFKEQGKGV